MFCVELWLFIVCWRDPHLRGFVCLLCFIKALYDVIVQFPFGLGICLRSVVISHVSRGLAGLHWLF